MYIRGRTLQASAVVSDISTTATGLAEEESGFEEKRGFEKATERLESKL